MQKYLKHVNKLTKEINLYFNRNEKKTKSLFLDGTGICSSYQNTALSIIGSKRLAEFEEVHIISGSSYALFIFLALELNEFCWEKEDITRWNQHIHKWHKITPVTSFLKYITYPRFKKEAGKFGGHYHVCNEIFKTSFLNKKISDFSNKYTFWTFNSTKKKFIGINANNEFRDLLVSDVISMCTSIPQIFGEHLRNNDHFMDAMYAKDYVEHKKKILRDKKFLHLNMYKTSITEKIVSLKIHEKKNGNKFIKNDFYRFLFGFKNRNFTKISQFALFGEV